MYEQQTNNLVHGNVRHPKVSVSVHGQTVRQVETTSTKQQSLNNT